MSRDEASGKRRTVRLVHRNLGFESFLSGLSATFADVPAEEVDSRITAGLRQIVEFLGVDRSGFGQLVPGENTYVITHSYQVRGVQPTPKVVLDVQFPVYARKLREGTPFRLPDDIRLLEDATAERTYLAESGLVSYFPQFTGGISDHALEGGFLELKQA